MSNMAPYDLWLDNTNQNSVPANMNSLRNEVWLISVTNTLNTPGGAEVENTVLIVGTVPTGAFTGWANQLVIKKSGVWFAFAPVIGMIKWHQTLATHVRWTGTAWVDIAQVMGGQGTALASAATTTLANLLGDYGHITGTTTISSFGAAKAGTMRTLVFDGALTLTHGANIINLTGASIAVAVGDIAVFRSEGGTVWRMVTFQRASGQPLVVGTAAMEYKGAWNASTNTPALVNGTGNSGDQYRVSVAGSQNLGAGVVAYAVGDVLTYNGTTLVWDHAPAGNDPVGVTDRFGVYSDLGNVSGAVNIDCSAAEVYRMTLTGNVTFTFTNLPGAGRIARPLLIIKQDATGGRTVTWPALGYWPNGVVHVVSAAPDDIDHIGLMVLPLGIAWTGYPVEDVA